MSWEAAEEAVWRRTVIGSLVALGFGLVYVMVNTGSFPVPLRWALRGLALVLAALVVLGITRGREASAESRQALGSGGAFGRAYWLVVVAEVVAIFVGVRILAGPLASPDVGVAWVSVVVGLHFFALARVFGRRFFTVLGAAVTSCGLAGGALFFGGAPQVVVDGLAGVVPGFLLLIFACWGVRRDSTNRRGLRHQDLSAPGRAATR